MTRKQVLYTVVTASAISIIIILISLAYSMKEQRVEAHRKSLETTRIVETQPTVGYILKEYNGELAVFRGDSDTPYRLLGVPVSVMSDYDKKILKAGIFTETQEELNRLIEDYTS